MAARVARRRENEKSLLFCAGMQDLAFCVHSPPEIHLPTPDLDEHLIPSANSGGGCQGGEAGHAGLGAWPSVQPVHNP